YSTYFYPIASCAHGRTRAVSRSGLRGGRFCSHSRALQDGSRDRPQSCARPRGANANVPLSFAHAPCFILIISSAQVVTPLWGWLLRSEEHTSELQSRFDLVCRLL